jgi:hypothetical protein
MATGRRTIKQQIAAAAAAAAAADAACLPACLPRIERLPYGILLTLAHSAAVSTISPISDAPPPASPPAAADRSRARKEAPPPPACCCSMHRQASKRSAGSSSLPTSNACAICAMFVFTSRPVPPMVKKHINISQLQTIKTRQTPNFGSEIAVSHHESSSDCLYVLVLQLHCVHRLSQWNLGACPGSGLTNHRHVLTNTTARRFEP